MVVGRENMWNSNGVAPLKSKGRREARPLHHFPLPRCPHTRKELLTNRYPSALCSICFGPSMWNGRRACRGYRGLGQPAKRGLAVEIGVEDPKVEVGVLRRFQRLFDACGFGGDGVAEFAEQSSSSTQSSARLRRRGSAWPSRGGRLPSFNPSPGTGTHPESNDALRLPEGAELCRTRNRMDGSRVE